jgi:hypothetical protein
LFPALPIRKEAGPQALISDLERINHVFSYSSLDEESRWTRIASHGRPAKSLGDSRIFPTSWVAASSRLIILYENKSRLNSGVRFGSDSFLTCSNSVDLADSRWISVSMTHRKQGIAACRGGSGHPSMANVLSNLILGGHLGRGE